MTNDRVVRHRSLAGPIFLIALGALFLYANHRPEFDPWPVVWRYWPLLLIFWGLGRMWDSVRERQNPQGSSSRISAGTTIAGVGFVLVLALLLWHGRGHARPYFSGTHHDSQSVERQGAQTVQAKLEMPAGELHINGGGTRLLEADFAYGGSMGAPRVEYNVSGGAGHLDITQVGNSSIHFGRSDNDWNLRFANDVPLELDLNMGSGEGTLRLQGMDLTRLHVQMGAGQLNLDLTGDRKKNLEADIHGGVGQAIIRLPKSVGVKVHASGGIGSIDTHGLKREGDEYVNDAYGKSPVSIKMNVEGGVGEITLNLEP